jgi:hypothetical protein
MEIAIERAGELLQSVTPGKALPGRSLRKPYMALGAVLAIIGVIGVFSPALMGTQLSRFLDPFGDHPPFSRLKITVEPGDAKVLYGTSLDIKATTEGEVAERVDLVLRMASHDSAEEVLPMFPEGNGQWRATVSNVIVPGTYAVRSGSARSKFYQIEVITVPKLEGVRVRVTAPKYANKAVYEGTVPDGGIAGLAGTKVEIFAKSNRPLSGGAMDLSLEGALTPMNVAMFPIAAGSSEVVGTFDIQKSGKLELAVIDVNGQKSTETFSTQITLLADERPFVRLLQPMVTSFATPSTPIPIEVLAEDDNGVSKVQIYRSLNDSRALPTDIDAPKPNPTQFPVQQQLPLEQYGLKPGDVLKIYARVEDNDPAGAKGAESTIATVRIISEEDYKKMVLSREGMEVLQSKYDQARRRMEAINEAIEKLQEELKKAPGEGEMTEEQRKAMEKLAELMDEHAKEMQKSAMDDLPFDLDQNLKKELEKLAEQLKKEAQEAKKASKTQGMGVKGALDKLSGMKERLAGEKKEFEDKATEPLEHLAKIYPLMEDQAKYIQLYQRQRDLEERLSSMKDKENVDDPKVKARMRDLEKEQADLKENLRNLVEDIQKHADELPDDPKLAELKQTAQDFAKGVQDSVAAEEMANAEMGLSEFSGSRGHSGAKNAADTLEKFLSKCESMGGEGMACLKFSPGLAAGMGNTVQQLLDAAGLSPGSGMSAGSGNGSSASRTSLSNVGIYGKLPTRSQQARSGGGKAERGMSSDGTGRDPNDGRNGAIDVSGQSRTVGEADVIVPVRYKRRVGEYFQRVNDEIGEK